MSYLPPLPPNFDAALRDVGSRKPRAREASAARLATAPEGREEEAKRALRPLLDDPQPSVRQLAIASLGHLRDERALEVILLRFDDPEPGVRQVAVIAAAQIGDPRAVERLREALRDERADVRFQAAVSFAELAPTEAVDAIVPLLADDDAEVRGNAAAALGALGDRRAADAIAELLDDASPVARREAALALGKLRHESEATVGVLRECLADPDRAIEAALALGELRALAAREELAKIAGAFLTSLHLKAAAGAALARMDDPRGIVALRSVLHAFRHDGRSFAAQLVGEHGIVALAEDVAALLEQPRGADPAVVEEALTRLAQDSEVAARALGVVRAPVPQITPEAS